MSNYRLFVMRKSIIRIIALALALLLPILMGKTGWADEGTRENQNPDLLPPGNHTIVHGAHIPPIWQNNTEIHAFNEFIGKDAGIIMSFYPWDLKFEDNTCGFFDNTYRHRNDGGTPGVNDCFMNFDPNTPEVTTTYMITWEPHRNPTGNVACNVAPGNRTDLNAIINGSCDAYIDDFARRLKGWHDRFGDRFMIRFMHEMNISHSAWWQDDANYPTRFRQAFQRVVTRFRAQGATREMAQFVWSPNWQSNPPRDWNTIPNYYPGDQYVDWIGLSGYNWHGSGGQDPTWRTFDGLYVDPIPELGVGVLPYLHCTYAKPIVLAEFASVDGPGGSQTKAQWITNAYQRMLDFPHLRAAVWFNDYAFSNPGAADFRATHGSSDMDRGSGWPPAPGWQQTLGAPTDAFRTAVSGNRFVDTLPPLAEVTPTTTYCGPFPPVYLPPTIEVPNAVLVERGTTVSVQIQGQNLQGTYSLSVTGASSGMNVQLNPLQISPTSPYTTLTIQVPNNAATTNLTITGQASGLEPISQTVTVRVLEEVYRSYLPLTRK